MPPPTRSKTIGSLLISCESLLSNMKGYLREAKQKGKDGDDVQELERHLRNLMERMETIRTGKANLAGRVASTGTMVLFPNEIQKGDLNPQAPGGVERRGGGPDLGREGRATPEPRHMRLEGRSSSAQVADLLQFLANSGRSGTLRIKTDVETAHIRIASGFVTDAVSTESPDGLRLGDILVHQQVITEAQLRSILISSRDTRMRLGRALRNTGLVDAEDLANALVFQTRRLIERIMCSENMEFAFEERPDLERGDIRLNMTEILLDTARVHDEALRVP